MEYVQENKIKTNIKMKVSLEQSRRVQDICFENNIVWATSGKEFQGFYEYIYIGENYMYCFSSLIDKEIDADLFIRTNGTCEEDKYKMFDTMIQKPYDVVILEQKLKKKNEILKKAKIKRKNQREELHKLNIKLQKCISLEEHDLRMKTVLNEKHKLEVENKEMGRLVNLNASALVLVGQTKDLAMQKIEEQAKEIEKLKAVIEYLESKVK